MKNWLALGLLAAACSAQAVQLYDNGTVLNSGNLSVLPTANTTLGYTSSSTAAISLADNFTVTGAGWLVDTLDFYAYQTNATTFSYTNVVWSIVSGSNLTTGIVVASGTTGVTSGGIVGYRVSSTTLTSTARPIYRINADIPNVTLGAGIYWLTWSLTGSASFSGPFVPPTVAGSGDAQQNTGSGWNVLSDGGSLATAELPFSINGTVVAVPEPMSAALMLAGIVGLWGLNRQRATRPA